MKKTIILIVVVTFSLSIFSLDLEKVKEVYTSFINSYEERNFENQEFEAFFIELNNLGLYRFYRTQMIGSAEYIDRPTNIQTYLSQIFNNIQDEFETIEEKLALAGFLAYIQSDLSGQSMTTEMIRSLPAYFTTIQNYTRSLENEALTYFGNVIIYSLGIVDDAPYTDIQRFDSNLQISDTKFYIYNGEPNEEFNKIIEENKESLEEGIMSLIQSNISGRQLQFAIDNLSYRFVRPLLQQTQNQTQQLIQIFINEGKHNTNLSFLRYIAYGVLLLLAFSLFRKFTWLIGLGIFLAEYFYIITFYNPIKDTISSFIYGSFVIVFIFIFLAVIFFKSFSKKVSFLEKVVNLSLVVLTFLMLFIPSYYSFDLLMKENPEFHLSSFQNQLLNDILLYPHSPLNRSLENLTSLLGSEYSSAETFYKISLGNFLNNSLRNEILLQAQVNVQGTNIQTNRNGLKINKQGIYTFIPNNFAKEISNFVKSSEQRLKRIQNELDNIKNDISNVIKFSDHEFEYLVKTNSESILKKTDLIDPLLPQINTFYNVDKVNKINLNPYNTSFGTKIMVLFFLSFAFFVVFKEKVIKYISLLAMYVTSLLSFIKLPFIEVISQSGFPTVFTYNYSINLFYGLCMLVITTLLLLKLKLFSNSNK
ncbi:hypothetical protein [Petrotoga sp. 9PWA.NaAc.5.4]|uniref:hypothetical protein n=1 Tax=Petrotoga sp. 9PWA.NaAc.5.4 TaxID=1434328 RepID=UPI000CBBD4E9|nr:hypothetical protein [Petrotoga sp. 9PWA.NaAc.5.4]PNR97197.1 hypothetical protein X924_00505 [Petrotoga sp. 9PWA.NaAc.5.4]